MTTTNSELLMPPSFEDGLSVWSSEDGTPGSATYDGASNAALVSADQDFGPCLELLKTSSTQKLRYMGETPLIPGCYLKIRARVKAVSGNFPSVRIAGWAGAAGGAHVSGLTEVASSVTLDTYGKVVSIEAIVGTGARTGVELIWGAEPVYGHFGLDLTGANGGLLRIEDLEIEDVTGTFVREMLDVIDVKDFGAIGDGVTDDKTAFEAADAAADGRTVFVSEGVFHLGSSVTIDSEIRFRGTLDMPDGAILKLTKNFNLSNYIDAFGDEGQAFRKAFQAMLNYVDSDSLDMGGRKIDIDGPIDMQAAVGTTDFWSIRRVIRNGKINAIDSTNWDTDTISSNATYSISNKNELTGVSNISNIPIGSLVLGNGVGREVYVVDKNVGAATLTLSQPLYDAAGTQTYTFKRFKYLLDFTGFSHMAKLEFADVEFQMDGKASGVVLAPDGELVQFRDCWFTKPRDRGITSINRGCQGMMIDRCHFVSKEQSLPAQDRVTIGMNVNANDVKVRDSVMVKFRHFAIMKGTGHVLTGNHWYQGDTVSNGVRLAGFVFTELNLKTLINGNYVDNSFIEWANEHDASPDFLAEFSFGGLTVTGNIFTVQGVGSWFRWFVIKPYGTGHTVHGLNISGNVFRTINGNIDRIETVDDSIAPLDRGTMRNIRITGNSFNGIDQVTQNPVTLLHEELTPQQTWNVDFAGYLPFEGECRAIDSVVLHNAFKDPSNATVYPGYNINTVKGTNRDQARLNWSEAVSGKVWVTARMDFAN